MALSPLIYDVECPVIIIWCQTIKQFYMTTIKLTRMTSTEKSMVLLKSIRLQMM